MRDDTELADEVIARDDEVDQLNYQTYRELLSYMAEDPQTIPRATKILFISKYLERIADHATNIAEMVVYMVKGRSIKHMDKEQSHELRRLKPIASGSAKRFSWSRTKAISANCCATTWRRKASRSRKRRMAPRRSIVSRGAPRTCCVLDLMLPRMSGLEICRRMRSNPETARLPILVVTAKGAEVDRILGLEMGADDYVVKPFSPREVVARVKALAAARGIRDEPAVTWNLRARTPENRFWDLRSVR